MVEPTTANPPSEPPTAADRSGYRSPPRATIIGNTGPDAIPARVNRAIESGSDGAATAPPMATPIDTMHTIGNRRWSNRSEIADDSSRPSVAPAQTSDSASVAVASGAGSRYRTSQLDTPISAATYVAIATPSRINGPAKRRTGAPGAAPGATPERRRPLGIGTIA